MTIYNFNVGIGWASSGVEYAQAYRAEILRRIKVKAKFIFTDMITSENIEHLTQNIGFKDDEIIWLYTYFTDQKIKPTTYTLDMLIDSLAEEPTEIIRDQKIVKINFENENYVRAYLKDKDLDYVDRAEYVSDDFLIRKDYFTDQRVFTEYYTPKDNAAKLYQRRFFNTDGSIAYEEFLDGTNDSIFRFKDNILYSKEEFIAYFIDSLKLDADDILIMDREDKMGQQMLAHKGPARLGVVVHADHFSENQTDDDYILWNNYYDYQFSNAKNIDFFVVATDVQNKLLTEQFKKYNHYLPKIYTIPVGSLEKLYKNNERKPYSMVTASRLASEKHIDWIIKATVNAHKKLPKINLDIYGAGGQEATLDNLIKENKATDYIKLMGHKDLTKIYQDYEAYISASTSEGFGLTLMEAIGSGLPIIGFDVRYGNPNFVDDRENGYLAEIDADRSEKIGVKNLTELIEKLFTQNIDAMHEHSYKKAEEYLTSQVELKWQKLIKEQVGSNVKLI